MIELLAPAGCPDAGYAALEYGADALYLGLPKFSARAEAINFSPEEFDDLVGYAHSLERKVYVTLNTLVKENELEQVIDNLEIIAYSQADAVIVQDFGVLRIIQKFFPQLNIHASTQMAIHNREGVDLLRSVGIKRVTLARELQLEEISDIAGLKGIETEIFLHGALCYSYSGLCMFSSHTRGGRSANRGRCAYPCREVFTEISNGNSGHVFSLKDLALPEYINALQQSGVTSLKIEGRKKSPLYVANVVKLYRDLLDNPQSDYTENAKNVQTVFSRPWTDYFIGKDKRNNSTDSEVVGHRGTAAGTISTIKRINNSNWLTFKTAVSLELHDGLQIDLPDQERPFGFSIKDLLIKKSATYNRTFTADAGSEVQVLLPDDFSVLPQHAIIYRSSSQELKRDLNINRPKAGLFKRRFNIQVTCTTNERGIDVAAIIPLSIFLPEIRSELSLTCVLEKTRNADKMKENAKKCFDKTGDTIFTLSEFTFNNDLNLFIPLSELNELRRKLFQNITEQLNNTRVELKNSITKIIKQIGEESLRGDHDAQRLILKIDDPTLLTNNLIAAISGINEIILSIAFIDNVTDLDAIINTISAGKIPVRIALPTVIRHSDKPLIITAINKLLAAGITLWEVANLGALQLLRNLAESQQLHITADWPLYVLNRQSLLFLQELGLQSACTSPEDELDNITRLINSFDDFLQTAILQTTPLFIAEACPKAALADCKKDRTCANNKDFWLDKNGDRFLLKTHNCRSYFLRDMQSSRNNILAELRNAGMINFRLEFCYHDYSAQEIIDAVQQFQKNEMPDSAIMFSARHKLI